MSLSQPSQVSATTGRLHQYPVLSAAPCLIRHAITASRATPTLCVFVITIGPSRKPLSSTHAVPVISPLPLSEKTPAYTGSLSELCPRGTITVTPVRTGPLPTSSLPSPLISVVYPTSTPATSVIALNFPGVPSNGIPRSRARTILFSTKGEAGGCLCGSRAAESSTSVNESAKAPVDFLNICKFSPKQSFS